MSFDVESTFGLPMPGADDSKGGVAALQEVFVG